MHKIFISGDIINKIKSHYGCDRFGIWDKAGEEFGFMIKFIDTEYNYPAWHLIFEDESKKLEFQLKFI